MQKNSRSVAEHYHPELAVKILEHFPLADSVPKRKDGWGTASSLSKKVIGSPGIVKSYVEKFRYEYPEWFEMQKSGTNVAEHYHPDLVAKILEHFLSIDSVPIRKEGWETAATLSKKIIGSPDLIKSYVEKFRVEHSELFEDQKPKAGTFAEHYHPELAVKILEHFPLADSVPKRKEGWESSDSLMKKVFGSYKSVMGFAEKFRQEHPEWFEYQNNNARPAEHYHPELAVKILEHFPLIDSVPKRKEGWETASSLSKKIIGNDQTIKVYVEKFRYEYPEWFEMQKNGARVAEHYHPDLIVKILSHFPKKS